MSSKTKKVLTLVTLFFVLMMTLTSFVFAGPPASIYEDDIDTDLKPGTTSTKLTSGLNTIFASIAVVARVLAFAIFIGAGVRYMFAASDTRADIKKQTAVLLVGTALVFSSETILKLIAKVIEITFK